jgi:hypothetical protein
VGFFRVKHLHTLSNHFSLDSGEDDDDDAYSKPTKKKKPVEVNNLSTIPLGKAAKKPIARKVSSSMKPAKKGPAKKGKRVDEDEDESGSSMEAPVRLTAPKRAARAVTKTYIDLISDDEDENDGSVFEDD